MKPADLGIRDRTASANLAEVIMLCRRSMREAYHGEPPFDPMLVVSFEQHAVEVLVRLGKIGSIRSASRHSAIALGYAWF